MYLFTKKDLFYESHRIIFLRVTFIKLITFILFFLLFSVTFSSNKQILNI